MTRLTQQAQRAVRRVGLEVRRSRPLDREDLPYDLSAETVATIRRVRPYTLTSPTKIAGLCEAVRYVVRHGVPGDVVECGVWRGGSMMATALTLLECGDPQRQLHLFDTYEGMVEPGANDLRHDLTPPAEMMASVLGPHGDVSMWCYASIDDVRQAMGSTGYDPHRIHYVRGRTEETLPDHAPERIAILRLDTDWYESTRHELRHLLPRVSSGGVVILDDYGHWLGARKAIDEYLLETGVPILLNRLDEGRIGVVP